MKSEMEKMMEGLEMDEVLIERLKLCRTNQELFEAGFTCDGHISEFGYQNEEFQR